MKRLWAPWRMEYILGEKPSGCIFCKKPESDKDGKNFILHRAKHCYVIMNVYPYNNGHLMVIPYRHLDDMEALPDAVLKEMITVTKSCCSILRECMAPQGFNIGANVGEAAGAGISEHVHFHIVPRWRGDVNYMSVIDDVRVLPQALKDTYKQLLPHFKKLADKAGK